MNADFILLYRFNKALVCMNSFFRRLPLSIKLLLIGVIPFLVILFISYQFYKEKAQSTALLGEYISRIEQSANISDLIEQLQTERRYSYEFALKKIHYAEILNQRKKTDSSLNKLELEHNQSLFDFKNYTFLNDLYKTRKAIDSGYAKPDMVMAYYTLSIFRLNSLNNISAGSNVYLQPAYDDLVGQKLLSEMITFLSIIRANIYNILYTQKDTVGTLYGTVGSHTLYHSYEKEFLLKASASAIQAYQQIRNTSQLKPTMDYLDRTFKKFYIDSTYSADNWWSTSHEATDRLRHLRFTLWNRAKQTMNTVLQNENKTKNQTLLFLVLTWLFVIVFSIYTISVITKMLTELKESAQKISIGATGLHLKNLPDDAIGSLAQSILKIDENNKMLAEAAAGLGKGNFNITIQPRSPQDILGNALVQMKNELQQFTHKIELSKEQFKQLADFVPQMVWTARADGYLDYYNRQWYEFTGFKEGYGDQSWIPILHPDDVQYCIDTWYNSVKKGTPYLIEYRFKDRKNGGYRWFLGKALPIKDQNENIIKWFGTCTDIHDQKMFAEDLENRVKERTEELNQANTELQRSNNELEQFAYIASHDLQEPLRKIKTFAELIKDNGFATADQTSNKYIEKISLAADRMRNIIKDLLDFSHLNKSKEHFVNVNLNQILENVKLDLELVIAQKGAVIEAGLLPDVEAIPIQMNQLFYNLINNAIKFTREDKNPHIKIDVKKLTKENINSMPGLDAQNKYYEIKFTDNGIGFDQEYAEQIFIMFQRLNAQSAYNGTGIGLALCKKIVENHTGIIYASSKPGEGAVFTVILPQMQKI